MLMRPIPADAPPVPLQQSDAWATALAATGRRVTRRNLDGFGHLLVADVPLWRLGPISVGSRGPVWASDAMPTDRSTALQRSGPRVLNVEDPDPVVLSAAGYRQILTPASIAELPLWPDDGLQIAQCNGKWRNALTQARRKGIDPRPVPADRDLLDWLLHRDAGQQRQKGYRGLPAHFVRSLVAAAPHESRIWIAGPRVAPLAAMLILRHGLSATYLLGWSGRAGRAASAHHAILMAAATRLGVQGCRSLDLGLIDTVNAPGLARFKIGSGARVRTLGGTWLRLPGLAQRDLAC